MFVYHSTAVSICDSYNYTINEIIPASNSFK